MIDLHAHILPGLDDGASSFEEALAMARAFLRDRVTTVAATPHYVPGSLEQDPQTILEKTGEINRQMAGEGGFLLLPGMEVQVEASVPGLLAEERLLTINNGGKYLLLELPFLHIPDCTCQVIRQLKKQGVTAVIAHPERNQEISRRPELAGELVRDGALLQLNGGSLLGHFGPEVKRAASALLSAGWVHLAAGDAHRASGSRGPCLDRVRPMLEKAAGREGAEMLLDRNPAAIISGQQVSQLGPRPEKSLGRGIWAGLFRK